MTCDMRFANRILLGRHMQRFHEEESDIEDAIEEPGNRESLLPMAETELNGFTGNSSCHHRVKSSEPESPINPIDFPIPSPQPQKTEYITESASSPPTIPAQMTTDHPERAHRNIAFEVIEFFNSFCDDYEELYPGIRTVNPPLEEICPAAREVLKHCTTSQLTLGESASVFRLVCTLENLNPDASRPLSSQFPKAESFCSYLDKVRKITVKKEGWRRAIIRTKFGLNRTGVFRSVLNLMIDVLTQAGGLKAIIPFKETYRDSDGERVFSAPWNSEAMGEYQRSLGKEGCLVLVDSYSDGLTLSGSGTQSVNNMRVRFSNIKGQTHIWHDIGIVPIVDTEGEKKSDSLIRQEKLALLQRFNYLVLKDVIRTSHTGHLFGGTFLYARIGVGVFDQPQERAETSLKDHNSFRDCTLCVMPTKIKQSSQNEDEPLGTNKRARLGVGSHTDTSATEILKCQLHPDPAEPRDVYQTVKSQLIVANRKHHQPATTSGTTRSGEDSAVIKRAKNYLEEASALEFPPALAAFSGMGSFPYRLYSCIGFDKLHVIEHGILRLIPDDAYKLFESAAQYNGWSKGDVVKISNQRLLDAPRSAQLPSFQPFRKVPGEKQAGITGKMRRDTAPFLWYALMGIPNQTPPDDDPLVQLLLTVDFIQQELLGINRKPDFAVEHLNDEVFHLKLSVRKWKLVPA